jgi:hypothetical protein
MVHAMINLKEHQDRVLAIVKGKYGFKNKSDAMNFVISKFEEKFLEPELKPEFVERIHKIEKRAKYKHYKSVDELRKEIENA